MKKIVKYTGFFGLGLLTIGCLFFLYLNRGLATDIVPATFTCQPLEEGYFASFDTLPGHIYGIGLSYAGHIRETASAFDPAADPPVFQKSVESITSDLSKVAIPVHAELVQAVEQLEAGIGAQLDTRNTPLPALMDYEVELGFVLLEDIDTERLSRADYVPIIGFFIANDLSARSIAILGEGQANRHDYWGISKSFEGFTPVSEKVWIPQSHSANTLPCIRLQTFVNGALRQDQQSSDLIYTPRQMLRAIHRKYPDIPLAKGDWVLTGTPGGVVLSTPRWLVRLANMLGMDRFDKLKQKTGKDDIADYLKAGDTVVSKGAGIGQVTINIGLSK